MNGYLLEVGIREHRQESYADYCNRIDHDDKEYCSSCGCHLLKDEKKLLLCVGCDRSFKNFKESVIKEICESIGITTAELLNVDNCCDPKQTLSYWAAIRNREERKIQKEVARVVYDKLWERFLKENEGVLWNTPETN